MVKLSGYCLLSGVQWSNVQSCSTLLCTIRKIAQLRKCNDGSIAALVVLIITESTSTLHNWLFLLINKLHGGYHLPQMLCWKIRGDSPPLGTAMIVFWIIIWIRIMKPVTLEIWFLLVFLNLLIRVSAKIQLNNVIHTFVINIHRPIFLWLHSFCTPYHNFLQSFHPEYSLCHTDCKAKFIVFLLWFLNKKAMEPTVQENYWFQNLIQKPPWNV